MRTCSTVHCLGLLFCSLSTVSGEMKQCLIWIPPIFKNLAFGTRCDLNRSVFASFLCQFYHILKSRSFATQSLLVYCDQRVVHGVRFFKTGDPNTSPVFTQIFQKADFRNKRGELIFKNLKPCCTNFCHISCSFLRIRNHVVLISVVSHVRSAFSAPTETRQNSVYTDSWPYHPIFRAGDKYVDMDRRTLRT